MTVRLELKPETEAKLSDLAKAKGLSVDTYIQNVIEDIAHSATPPKLNVLDLRVALDRLAELGRGLPPTSSSAFSREDIYRDHD